MLLLRCTTEIKFLPCTNIFFTIESNDNVMLVKLGKINVCSIQAHLTCNINLISGFEDKKMGLE